MPALHPFLLCWQGWCAREPAWGGMCPARPPWPWARPAASDVLEREGCSPSRPGFLQAKIATGPGFLCIWCIYSVNGSGTLCLSGSHLRLGEETPSPSRAFARVFHAREASALPTGTKQMRSWRQDLRDGVLCAGPQAWGQCRSRGRCPVGAVRGAQRCPPTPAFAQQGQSLRDGKILSRKKEEKSLQASSRGRRQQPCGGRCLPASLGCRGARRRWRGQGWHKSPPAAVTRGYFSKQITKEAKYTFFHSVPQSGDSPDPKNKSLLIVPGPELDCLRTKPAQLHPSLSPLPRSGPPVTRDGVAPCPLHLPRVPRMSPGTALPVAPPAPSPQRLAAPLSAPGVQPRGFCPYPSTQAGSERCSSVRRVPTSEGSGDARSRLSSGCPGTVRP